jgi:hypothetical protein
MKYVLGNMLGAAGSLNPDGLSLDLQFAADKTLTARKGPTPVFTRASTATFVGSDGLIQSAAVNEPRFDHDPLTLACKGLLIEEARTNLLLQSEDFGTTWTQTNISVSSNVAVAPDGNTTADKIIENTATAIHGVDQSTTFTAIPYTLSFYAKKDGRIWVRAFLGGLASTWFNIDNGTIGTVASGFTASIVNAGNGWYRCSITGTASAGTLTSGVRMATSDGNNSYLGDGTSGIFLWGAQLEAGSFPTSYIPTTTAALARSADVCSITGADVHPSNGTLVVEFDRRMLNLSLFRSPGRVSASASVSGADSVGIDHNDVSIRAPIRAAATTLSTLISSNESLGNTKVAVAWSSGDSAHVSGGIVRASTSTAIAFTNPLDTISFAGIPAAAISTTISSIRYYKKRLANGKLQSLTT